MRSSPQAISPKSFGLPLSKTSLHPCGNGVFKSFGNSASVLPRTSSSLEPVREATAGFTSMILKLLGSPGCSKCKTTTPTGRWLNISE